MTVALHIAKTLTGSDVADVLPGGSSGYDFGVLPTGGPYTVQAFYVKHDGTQYISEFAVNLQAMSGTYGGDYNASTDLAKVLSDGDAGNGLQIDWNYTGTPFGGTPFVFSNTLNCGKDYANRVYLPTTTMAFNNAGTLVAPSGAVQGQLGPIGNSVLGDHAHFNMRYVSPNTETLTGKRQFDIYYSFNFTS